MTKPKNFPGRKTIRQMSALERMRKNPPISKDHYPTREIEMNRIEELIKKGGKKFTKKDRSGSTTFKPAVWKK